jgi:hypothetical protein
MKLTQDTLNKIWDIATTVGKVDGWSADNQGDKHLLVPDDLVQHGHYQRTPPNGDWEAIPGMAAKHA